MRRQSWWNAPALAAGLVLLVLGCSRAPKLGPTDGLDLPPTDLERVQVGDTAPDFTLRERGGDLITLSDFRGKKTVVLVFYRGHW